jgi:hypothetical protein
MPTPRVRRRLSNRQDAVYGTLGLSIMSGLSAAGGSELNWDYAKRYAT